MGDLKLDDERERQWRVIFEDNNGGLGDNKTPLHDKRWDVYVNEKKNLIKGDYLVEVVGYDGKKVLWEVVENHAVEEGNDHEEIGLRGVGFYLFDKYEKGVSREGLSEYPYLLMSMNLCPGDFKNQLKRRNMNMDEDNGEPLAMVNGWFRKI